VDQQLILNRYRPLGELGKGGFGTVTLAWDTRMQRRVAIKRLPLPRDVRGTLDLHPPGLAEARTAALLNHPAIVTVYDFETDPDEAFIIMEFVDGASLQELLDDVGGPLTLDEAAAIVEGVASALQFAHENGVLHLDIKPANVLVSRDGRVKVTDFGMAALSSASGHQGAFGGTISYMPLEQLEGLDVMEASDEWSLATLAFECLTGVNPFDANDVPSAIALITAPDPPTASSYQTTLPGAIDDVLFAGTGPHLDERYPDVAHFAAAVEPHLGDAGAGRASLAELVAAYAEEEPLSDEPGWENVGLWDRLQGSAGTVAVRTIAAVESAWLAWAGLAWAGLQTLPLFVVVALVAVVGALAPSLGTGLGLVAFAVGLFVQRLWVLAALFSVGAAVWWWFVARRSAGAAVLPLSAPMLAAAQVPYLMPLLAGFALPPAAAAAAGLCGGALAFLAAAASGVLAPFRTIDIRLLADPDRALSHASAVGTAFANPATWIALLGWAGAAAVMSVFCRRASRLSAVLGAVAGSIVLAAFYELARLAGGAIGVRAADNRWTATPFIVSLVVSLILVVLVAALGAPVRAEHEDLVQPLYEDDE
jgi:predicted Ser/Thr protein kinase